MHFHLPKPMHSWREFIGEVGIIVFGVLIALGAEALVEETRWHAKVEQARLQLRREVGHDLALLDYRISLGECVNRRLDQLEPIVSRAASSGKLAPLGRIGGVSSPTWPSKAWDTQVAAETASHFPAEQIGAIGRIYAYIQVLHGMSEQEETAWMTLNGMVGPGRPVDAATVSRLIDALVTARAMNKGFGGMQKGIQRVLINGGLGKDFPQIDPNNPPVIGGRPIVCDPIGKPPANYGL